MTRRLRRTDPRNVLPVDIFSSGTLRDEDVGDALAGILSPLTLSRTHRALLREWEREREREIGDVDLGDLVADLWNAAEDYLPPYTFIGSSEGDGALFGVWPALESLTEDAVWLNKATADNDVIRVDDTGHVPVRFSGYVMQVSDHGNVTLYAATRGRLREIWSVV